MALVANGARLRWLAYQFGHRVPNGEVWEWPTLEEAQAAVVTDGGEVVMRAVYTTGWETCLDAAQPGH